MNQSKIVSCSILCTILMIVFSAIVVVIFCDHHIQQTESSPVPVFDLPKLVLFSFDGFRNDFVDSKKTPNLYALANAGVRGYMQSTFVTKTYPNHQSIVTGLYQPYHGIINNEFIDPQSDGHFDVDDESTFWWDQFNKSVPIYIANQRFEKNRFSGSIQWPGSIAAYTDGTGKNTSDRMHIHYVQKYDHSIDWYKRIDLVIKWLTDPHQAANLVVVYFNEPDSTAHQYGPFSEQVAEQVQQLDKVVGYFRQKLSSVGLAHRTNLIFLSDHGFSEVKADRMMYLNKCDPDFPGLKYKLYGSSPDFSVIPIAAPTNSTKGVSLAQQVCDALNQCAEKHFKNKFTAYLQQNIPDSFHYKNNRRILPVFLLAEDGYDLAYKDEGWKPKGYPVWGNHGYNQSLPSMRPLFIAHGRAFKSAYQHSVIFENIDLYPLMLHLLQIPHDYYPSNGSFARVRDMLTNQLYLSDEDYLIAHSASDSVSTSVPWHTKWIELFFYIALGFFVIFFAGTCFVLTAGFNKKGVTKGFLGNRSSTSASLHGSSDSRLVSYLRQMLNTQRSNDGYRMFANGRPSHLDSSSSFDDDDNDEDELFQRKPTQTNSKEYRKKRKNQNKLTEIDWDIIGTGLDIDLASQINDSGMVRPSERAEYLPSNGKNSDSDEEGNSIKPKTNTNESISLLVDGQNSDDDEADEDIMNPNRTFNRIQYTSYKTDDKTHRHLNIKSKKFHILND